MASWLWAIPAEHYPVYLRTGTFAVRKRGRRVLEQVAPGDLVFAYLSGSRMLAGLFEVVSRPFEDDTPLVRQGHFPHRVRVRPVVVLSEEAWIAAEAFQDKLEVIRSYPAFRAVVQQVIHPLSPLDAKVLEFLLRTRASADLEQVFHAYEAYLQARQGQAAEALQEPRPAYQVETPFARAEALEAVIDRVAERGFVYEPWQVAAFVTALRTKPFVILAGVTGTGKSKLPALVAEATGSSSPLFPVRPDWTDSAEVLGYVDLQGGFRPGALLQVARQAAAQPARTTIGILDEMNLARVEHYCAELLSRMEDRHPSQRGGFETAPLLDLALPPSAQEWTSVVWPSNLLLVGTVNMDESAHGFSRKVLDRAFTLELAEVALSRRPRPAFVPAPPTPWPVSAWWPRALMLAGLEGLTPAEEAALERGIEALTTANRILTPAQLQVGYRTRDEMALFVLHAAEVAGAFRTHTGTAVDPLDLALHMKVLPRLHGGSRPVRRAVYGLLGWAAEGRAFTEEDEARPLLEAWERADRPSTLPGLYFPRTAARLCLMWERLLSEGFTAFWH
jgi:hypothetical protein